jgi:hypothetical protein
VITDQEYSINLRRDKMVDHGPFAGVIRDSLCTPLHLSLVMLTWLSRGKINEDRLWRVGSCIRRSKDLNALKIVIQISSLSSISSMINRRKMCRSSAHHISQD